MMNMKAMEIPTLINQLTKAVENHDIEYTFKKKGKYLESLIEKMDMPIEVVHHEGGYEDDGRYTSGVLYFPEHDIYLRCEGTHNSYYGTEFRNVWHQVIPRQVTITVFDSI